MNEVNVKSKFAFSVKSTTRRGAGEKPELTLAGQAGKIKINEACSKLVGIRSKEFLAFVSNEDQVREAIRAGEAPADTPITWGIIKGYPELDDKGRVIKTPLRLTKTEREELIQAGKVDNEGKVIAPEVDRYKGSKMSSHGNIAGYGALDGSDMNSWMGMNGVTGMNRFYKVDEQPIQLEIDGEVRDVYTLEFDREEKVVDKKAGENE